MRKIISLLLAAIMIFSLSSCKKNCKHQDKDADLVCDECEALLHKNDSELEQDSQPDQSCKHEFLPATCTGDGFCIRCGEEGDKATGHIPGEFIVNLPPLCGVAGDKIRPCSSCEEVVEVVEIPALEHEWVGGVCIHCDEPQP